MFDPKFDEFQFFYGKLKKCKKPEDLFGRFEGKSPEEQEKAVKSLHRGFIKQFGPDYCDNSSDEVKSLAHEIMLILLDLNSQAEKKIEAGTYGTDAPEEEKSIGVIEVEGKKFTLVEEVATGNIATIYRAKYEDSGTEKQANIKIAVNPSDNRFIEKEIKVLKRLKEIKAAGDKKNELILQSLPRLIGSFVTTKKQKGLVMEWLESYDLVILRENVPEYQRGIPQQHVFWIFLRLLNAVGYLHANGIIHGNLTPEHLIIRPYSHNVFPIDFTGAVMEEDPQKKYEFYGGAYSAPEIKNKAEPEYWHDLYSIGRCMIYALGGNIETGELPKNIDSRLADFALKLAGLRPADGLEDEYVDDAWRAYHKLMEIRYEITGKTHEFLPFAVKT